MALAQGSPQPVPGGSCDVTVSRARTLSLAEGLAMATFSPVLLTGLALLLGWTLAAVLILAANGR